MSLDLEKQLCFYGAYHHNPTNIAIHMTFVPLILASSLLLATNSPTIPLPQWLTIPNLPLNAGTIGAALYSGFYILLEPVAGSILLPIIISWTAFANHLTSSALSSTANQTSIAIFIMSWIGQFIGHGAFEGRAPALFDNLVQAFVLAPFFVFMEALFKFGYRPELQKRVAVGVEKELKKYHAEKAQNGTVKNGKAN